MKGFTHRDVDKVLVVNERGRTQQWVAFGRFRPSKDTGKNWLAVALVDAWMSRERFGSHEVGQ